MVVVDRTAAPTAAAGPVASQRLQAHAEAQRRGGGQDLPGRSPQGAGDERRLAGRAWLAAHACMPARTTTTMPLPQPPPPARRPACVTAGSQPLLCCLAGLPPVCRARRSPFLRRASTSSSPAGAPLRPRQRCGACVGAAPTHVHCIAPWFAATATAALACTAPTDNLPPHLPHLPRAAPTA